MKRLALSLVTFSTLAGIASMPITAGAQDVEPSVISMDAKPSETEVSLSAVQETSSKKEDIETSSVTSVTSIPGSAESNTNRNHSATPKDHHETSIEISTPRESRKDSSTIVTETKEQQSAQYKNTPTIKEQKEKSSLKRLDKYETKNKSLLAKLYGAHIKVDNKMSNEEILKIESVLNEKLSALNPKIDDMVKTKPHDPTTQEYERLREQVRILVASSDSLKLPVDKREGHVSDEEVKEYMIAAIAGIDSSLYKLQDLGEEWLQDKKVAPTKKKIAPQEKKVAPTTTLAAPKVIPPSTQPTQEAVRTGNLAETGTPMIFIIILGTILTAAGVILAKRGKKEA